MKRFKWIAFLVLLLLMIACKNGYFFPKGRWNTSDPGYDLSTDPANDWHGTYGIRVIDSSGDVGNSSSIAVDEKNVYISYMDRTNNDLKFARSADEGAAWAISTIDSTGIVGMHTSIAAEGSSVYISYWDETNRDLKFSKSVDGGNNWEISIVDPFDGMFSSIAVQGSEVYISYGTGMELSFAKSTDGGSTWTTTIPDSDGFEVMYTSIAVIENIIVISYTDTTNQCLKFAISFDSGSNWSISTVDSGGLMRNSSIAIVGHDNIYISYYNETTEEIRCAESNDAGSNWTISTVDTMSHSWGTSIAADYNNIYIAYNGEYRLQFARSNNSTWDTTTVDSREGVGWEPSITLSPHGENYIYISYKDDFNDDLKFAKSVDGGKTW